MTLDDLRSQLGPRLLEPGKAGYDSARVVWNGMIDRRPVQIARCRNAADVSAAVTYAAIGRSHGRHPQRRTQCGWLCGLRRRLDDRPVVDEWRPGRSGPQAGSCRRRRNLGRCRPRHRALRPGNTGRPHLGHRGRRPVAFRRHRLAARHAGPQLRQHRGGGRGARRRSPGAGQRDRESRSALGPEGRRRKLRRGGELHLPHPSHRAGDDVLRTDLPRERGRRHPAPSGATTWPRPPTR